MGVVTHGMTYAPIYRQWAAMFYSRLKAGATNPFSKQRGNCKHEGSHGL
jgi:hypothetical protein